MAFKPQNSSILVSDSFDMTAASVFDLGLIANCKGFRMNFWEVNQNGAAQGFALRFNAGGLISAGYDSVSIERVTGGGTGTIFSSTTDMEINGISGLGISRGWWEGHKAGDATDEWYVNGQFYDDNDDSVIDHHAHIDLAQAPSGLRLNSANVTNYTAGFFNLTSWN